VNQTRIAADLDATQAGGTITTEGSMVSRYETIIRDARHRAHSLLDDYIGDVQDNAGVAIDITEFVVDLIEQFSDIDWRYQYGEAGRDRRAEAKVEIEARALARWPRDVSEELLSAEARLRSALEAMRSVGARNFFDDLIPVELRASYTDAVRCLDAAEDRVSRKDQKRERMRERVREIAASITSSWLETLSFAAGGPTEAFWTTLSDEEETIAGISAGHRQSIFERHLATALADAAESRKVNGWE
jgi:hypothetical protein